MRKAAEDSRTPKRYREIPRPIASARFWSAAVLCRFITQFIGDQNRCIFRRATFSLLIVFAFTGCNTFKPVEDLNRYYVLSAVAKTSTNIPANQNLTLGVAPVEMPGYLQSTRIAVRRGTNEIYYSDYHQWAEHLDKGIQRVLASDLSTLLPSARVISSAWQPGDVKAEVHVSIQRFDLDESGDVALECEWRILSPNGGRGVHVDHSLISKKGPPLATNPTGAVGTLNQALAELSNQIAAALKTSE